MKIPPNISRKDVLSAIEKIDREGVRDGRESTRYSLRFQGKLYPPKYVITLANVWANGEEFDSNNFSGGYPTNRFLEKLGFEIVNTPTK